jgi:hypothetical protein
MATLRAVRYREKACELYEVAASAANAELREQFTSLARQYEHLAEWIEGIGQHDTASDTPARMTH